MNIKPTYICNDNKNRIIDLNILSAKENEQIYFKIEKSEYVFIILTGQAEITTQEMKYSLGPRQSPITSKPDILYISKPQEIKIISLNENTVIAIASTYSTDIHKDQFISSKEVRESIRGEKNWQRKVRLGLWSDNSIGEKLLIGETIVPPGNWSAMPAHKHDKFIKEDNQIKQVPYQEIYFFHFPEQEGFGICKLFSDNYSNLLEVKDTAAVLITEGYHTVVNSPLSPLYHLTIMAGPYRMSAASIHDDYMKLIKDDKQNPYRNQEK